MASMLSIEQPVLAALADRFGAASQTFAIDTAVDHYMRHMDPYGPYSRAMLCAIMRKPASAAANCA